MLIEAALAVAAVRFLAIQLPAGDSLFGIVRHGTCGRHGYAPFIATVMRHLGEGGNRFGPFRNFQSFDSKEIARTVQRIATTADRPSQELEYSPSPLPAAPWELKASVFRAREQMQ